PSRQSEAGGLGAYGMSPAPVVTAGASLNYARDVNVVAVQQLAPRFLVHVHQVAQPFDQLHRCPQRYRALIVGVVTHFQLRHGGQDHGDVRGPGIDQLVYGLGLTLSERISFRKHLLQFRFQFSRVRAGDDRRGVDQHQSRTVQVAERDAVCARINQVGPLLAREPVIQLVTKAALDTVFVQQLLAARRGIAETRLCRLPAALELKTLRLDAGTLAVAEWQAGKLQLARDQVGDAQRVGQLAVVASKALDHADGFVLVLAHDLGVALKLDL